MGTGSGDFGTPIDADHTGTFNRGPFNGITFLRVLAVGVTASNLKVLDIDSDGDDDLVEVNGGAPSRVFINTAGSFSVASSNSLPVLVSNSVITILFGDFNSDGFMDVLYQNQCVQFSSSEHIAFLPGIGNGNFGTAMPADNTGLFDSGPFTGIAFSRIHTSSSDGSNMSVVDIDNDGDVDLVETNSGAPTRVLLNHEGTFRPAITSLPSMITRAASGLIFGDFDSDGYIDVLYQNQSARINTPASIALMLGTGNGTFGAAIEADSTGTFSSGPLSGITLNRVYPSGSSVANLKVVDIDNDGDDDLVETNSDHLLDYSFNFNEHHLDFASYNLIVGSEFERGIYHEGTLC